MRNFEVINREYVNPIDLNVLGQTYNTLEQGHQQAVAAAAELETAMANLDLNEAESEWRQQRINDIRTTLEENSNYGNAYSALDDIVRKQGSINSDPGLRGRLLAQQEYKKFQTSIDDSNLPDHYKEYYKRNNPYYYQDKVDAKGNIQQGDSWKPVTMPSKIVDNNEIMELAIKYTSPHKYKTTTKRFYNPSDGTVTLAPKDKDATPVLYDTLTNEVVELTEKDLRDGLEAALNANPIARQSLMQDWKIALDDYKHNREGLYNAVSPKGGSMSFDEFKESIFSPMYRSKSYRYSSIIESMPNKNLAKDIEASFGGGNNTNSNTPFALNNPGSPGDFVTMHDKSTITSLINARNANNNFKEELKNKYASGLNNENALKAIDSIDLSNNKAFAQAIPNILGFNLGNIDYSNRDEVVNALTANKDKDIDKKLMLYDDLISNYNINRALHAEDIHNANKYNDENAGTKSWAAKQLMSAALSNEGVNNLPDGNRHLDRLKKEYNQLMDIYFPPGAENLIWSITDDKAFNTFTESIKGTALESVIKFETGKQGQKVIKLPASQKQYIFEFADAIEIARASRNMWHKQWQDIKSEFSPYGDYLYNDNFADMGKAKSVNMVQQLLSNTPIIENFVGNTELFDPYGKARHVGSGNFKQFVNRIPLIGSGIRKWEVGMVEDTGMKLKGITNFRERLNRYSKEENEGVERTVELINFDGASSRAIMAIGERNSLINDIALTPEERKKYIQAQDEIIDSEENFVKNRINNTSFANGIVKIKDENNNYKSISTEEITKLGAAFDANKKNASINTAFDATIGKYVYKISFADKDKDEYIRTEFTLEPPTGSDLDIMLNDDPSLQARASFLLSQTTNKDIRLGSFSNSDIYAVPKGLGVYDIVLENDSTPLSRINTNTAEGQAIFQTMIDLKGTIIRLNNFNEIHKNYTEEQRNKAFIELVNNYINQINIITKLGNGEDNISTLIDNAYKESGNINNYGN